jgi:tetratricopeptide (TPR) repeat protein
MLLIIDNFEHLLDCAGLLSDILKAAPGVKVPMTSRQKLGLGGEVAYVIGGLSTPFQLSTEIIGHDAVKLFIEAANRTTAPVGEWEMDVVARICQMLGGMPLAILLAATWVDTLSLAEIETEIMRGLGILEADLRDAPARHQSIEAAFDYSWKRLTANEQLVFMRLSVFRDGFTREAAQAVTGATAHDLQRLVHTSFIQHLPSGRNAIHELMRQYGEHKLSASGELTLIREKHSRYFAELFRPVGEAGWITVDPETLESVNPDFENMRAAWHSHLARKDVIQLGQILDGIWVFLDMYSRSQEAIDLFEAALHVFRNDDGDDVRLFRGKIIALLGWFYGDIGLKVKALQLTEEALTMLRSFGGTDALLLAYAGNVIFLGMANELQEAMDRNKKGLELAREMGDSRWEGIFCYLMGSTYMALGSYQEVLKWADQMPPMGKLGLRGKALSQLGEYAHAEECLMQALSLNRYHRFGRAMLHCQLMENSVLSGDQEQAWFYMQRGLQYVDDAAYAWVALEFLQAALGLLISGQQYGLAVEVLSLVVHHANTMENTRANAAKYQATLKASLSGEEFSAAWQRGQDLDLGDLITDLMER